MLPRHADRIRRELRLARAAADNAVRSIAAATMVAEGAAQTIMPPSPDALAILLRCRAIYETATDALASIASLDDDMA